MNKRDDLIREKFYQTGHSRGKSLNAINLNHLANSIREASRQKEIPSFTKINPLNVKPSKMTPDESFRLRARNSTEKRADIILSRSNSDFANANSKSPNQLIIQLNPEIKSSNVSNNLHNSVNFGTQNHNYTGYGNFYRENSSINIYNQKRNLAANLKENNSNFHNNNNSKINSSAFNSKIHRSPIDPSKSSKISPIRVGFNSLDKPSRENHEKDALYRTSYNTRGANGFGGSHNFESTNHKIFPGSYGTNVNLNNGNNGGNASTGANNNGHSHNFLVVNSGSLIKSVDINGDGISEANYAGGRTYLPNVTSKNYRNSNGNGKEKGLYNGNQQYDLPERKEGEYLSSNSTNLTHYVKNLHGVNNHNQESNQSLSNYSHNHFHIHQPQGNSLHPSQTKYSSKSVLNQLQSTNNKNIGHSNYQENQMHKTSNGLSSNNTHNSNPNGKYYERYSDHYEINGSAAQNPRRHQNPQSSLNGLKRRTESYSKIELQENNSSNTNFNNHSDNNNHNINNHNDNNKENRDYTPSSLHSSNNTNFKKTASHERKKSLGETRRGLNGFFDSQNPNDYSSNNLSHYGTRDSRALKSSNILQKSFVGKSKAGRQYNGMTKTNQDSYLMKNKVLGLDNYAIFGVFDGHGSHGHFISNMIKVFFSEYFSKPELYLSPQIANANTRSSVNGNIKNNLGAMNKTNYTNSQNAFNSNNHSNINYNNNNNFIGNGGSAWKDFQSTSTANSNFFSAASGLSNNSSPNSQLKEDLIYEKIKERNYAMLKNSFNLAESGISMSKYEVNFSGSTCIMLFMVDNKLICANAGDSRAILVSQKGNTDLITPLSRDHKPELTDEMYRINRLNGRVDRFNDNGIKTGPFRVWLKNQNYPGLAMSRSIGDLVAGSVGVICEPEVFECELNEKAKFVVIASDGIWEFLSNEKVADFVNPFYYANLDVNGAADKLVEEATKCWRREDETVDDITVVVIFFHSSHN